MAVTFVSVAISASSNNNLPYVFDVIFRAASFESRNFKTDLVSVFPFTEIRNELAVSVADKPSFTPTLPGFKGLRQLAVTHACVASAVYTVSIKTALVETFAQTCDYSTV